MGDEPRKRSRFDQAEPDPPRRSKFDRRSRSPAHGDSEANIRSRSPVAKSVEGAGPKRDAAAVAAEAAARINAQINRQKPPTHVDVPPIRATNSPSAVPGSAKSPSAAADSGTLNVEIYQQDDDYIKDIEVNDLRNRYTLTKGSTQKMIKEETGADVTTRGNYYPDKKMATAANPPLYLHVTSTSKDGLDMAVKKIDELMKQELPNLIDERRFRRPREEQPQVERDHLGRRKWPEERIPIDLEPIPGFNLRAQVVGAGGSYVKHIQQETRCRVQIKGRGSGFKEHETQMESDEQMYLHVAGPDPVEVENAKGMCISLLDSVKQSYAEFKERPPRGGGGYGGGYGGGDERGGERGGYGGRGRDRDNGSYGGGSSYNGGGQSGYGGGGGGGGSSYGGGYASQTPTGGYGGGAQSPPAAVAQTAVQPATAAAPMTAEQQQANAAWAQYYAQNPHEDPYAQYGGFGAVMAAYGMGGAAPQQQEQPQQQQQQYADYYQSQMAQAGTPMMQNGAGAPPPPPPEDNFAPPPPPPGPPGSAGGYSSVPPPPGM